MAGTTNAIGRVINSTSPLPVGVGGTGTSSTFTQGSVVLAGSTGAYSELPAVATGRVLISNGVGVAPGWSASPTISTLSITNGFTSLGANAALSFSSALSQGNYINFGTGGRNIGVTNAGRLFSCSNLNYSPVANTYAYDSSAPASAIELSPIAGELKYAPAGTGGNTVTLSTALTWDSAGNVNLSGLTASSLVATDVSKNLTSSVSGLSPTFTGLTLSGLTASLAVFTNASKNLTSTGTLTFAQGGFGFSTATTGDIFLATATNTPGKLPAVATGQVLISNGAAAPVYSATPTLSSLQLNNGNTGLTNTNSVLFFSSVLSDGNYINLGTGGRNIGATSAGSLFLGFNAAYNPTTNGYLYADTGLPSSVIEIGSSGGFLRYAPIGTSGNPVTLSNALDWDLSGVVTIPAKLNIGPSQTQAIATALNIRGTNGTLNSAANWFTSSDQYPMLQLLPYIHDNVSMNIDAYFDGIGWRSSSATGSYQLQKAGGYLAINYGTNAAGSSLTWNSGWQFLNTGDLNISAGDLLLGIAGKTISYKTGANAAVFSGAVMVGGVVTVNTTAATTGSIVSLMRTAAAGTPGPGMPVVTISNGVSLTITGGSLEQSTWSGIINHIT